MYKNKNLYVFGNDIYAFRSIYLSYHQKHVSDILVYCMHSKSALFFVWPLLQLETLVLAMQDPQSGVKSSEQKLNTTSIPNVIAGKLKKNI